MLPLSSFSLPPFFQPLHLRPCPYKLPSNLFQHSFVLSHTDICLDALGCALSTIYSSPLSFFIFHLQSAVLTTLKHFFLLFSPVTIRKHFFSVRVTGTGHPRLPRKAVYLHPWGVIWQYWLWWPCLSREVAQVTSRAPSAPPPTPAILGG